ncbi:MAG: helix-turn-helix domain-containing protein [Pseudohongiella sp.]|nr:helix-turn-helix domain-containing protein [Pseudohongiella sp.]
MQCALCTTKQAAQYLGVSPAFLERDRWAGARIPFVKLGSRSIRYRLSDLDNFIVAQIRTSTSNIEKSHGCQ